MIISRVHEDIAIASHGHGNIIIVLIADRWPNSDHLPQSCRHHRHFRDRGKFFSSPEALQTFTIKISGGHENVFDFPAIAEQSRISPVPHGHVEIIVVFNDCGKILIISRNHVNIIAPLNNIVL